MKDKIDVIIPAYNAHNTITKTLDSIVSQTIKDNVVVTIVNDCSDNDYENIYNKYKNYIDINIINLEDNMGCGTARQIGLDNTTNEYIVFIDADDLLYYKNSLENLYNGFVCDYIDVVYGKIKEYSYVTKESRIINPNHFTYIFGSMFKREFIEKNKIEFTNTSVGEDVGFNKKILLLSYDIDGRNINYIKDVVYLWTDLNELRINNSYLFNDFYSKVGYLKNMVYAHRFCINKVSEKVLTMDSDITMRIVFDNYVEICNTLDIEYKKRFYELCFWFYVNVYKIHNNHSKIYNSEYNEFIESLERNTRNATTNS